MVFREKTAWADETEREGMSDAGAAAPEYRLTTGVARTPLSSV